MSAAQQGGGAEVPKGALEPGASGSSWTVWLRERAVRAMPPERLLPDRQPSYVASWIYVFGAVTIGALVVIITSGVILALKGPTWWHESSVGHFFNSIHLWSVELFFFAMVVHLWGKFFMAAWRGGRARTWSSGALTFLVAVGAAFTGYVSQQNFDSQWISTQAKDAMNSVGIGAFFNVTNFGQMYSYHVLLLPVAVVVLVAAHVLLVRRHGVVPPLPIAQMRGERHRPVIGRPQTTGEGISRPPAGERAEGGLGGGLGEMRRPPPAASGEPDVSGPEMPPPAQEGGQGR